MRWLTGPLAVSFLAMLVGLLPGLRLRPSPLPFALAAALLLAALGVRAYRSRQAGRAPVTPTDRWLLLPLFALVGVALGSGAAQTRDLDCRSHLPDRLEIRAQGTLAASSAANAGERAPLLPLASAAISDGDGMLRCTAAVRVRLPDGAERIASGSSLTVEGRWLRSRLHDGEPGDGWPGDPLRAGYLVVDSIAEQSDPSILRTPVLAMRGMAEGAVADLFPRHGAVADALVLGRREALDPALRDRYARAGLAHLLAISGMHVGLIAGGLYLFGTILGIPRRRLAWGTIAVLGGYLALIGAPPSATRAGVMISLALLGLTLQRPFSPIPVVVTAALALVALNPATVLDIGFQLSFAGVLGILLIRETILKRIPADWRQKGGRRAVVESLVVSVAAFLATAPVAVYHFGLIAPVSPIANLPAIPILAVALFGVGASLLLHPLLPGLAAFAAGGTELVLDLLHGWAGWMAVVPGGHFTIGRPALLAALAAAATLAAGIHAGRRARPILRWGSAGAAALAVLLTIPLLAVERGGGLELHFLDVGQGDATAIRTPAGRWLLIDAGPRWGDFDAGDRRVVPFLRQRGAERVEAMVLTHPHADHIGGAPAVLRAFEVGTVIDPGYATGSPLYLEVLELVEELEVGWMLARSGRVVEADGVRLSLLWPDERSVDEYGDANEISAVVHLQYGDFAAIFTGDAYLAQEDLLVSRHGAALRANVLQAGHHGSRTSTGRALLAAVGPELVVVSAGRQSRYGHPHREVLERVAEQGAAVARTDREGTISVYVDPGGTAWRRTRRR